MKIQKFCRLLKMDLMTKNTKTQDALDQRVKLSDEVKTPLVQVLFGEENPSGTLTSYPSSKDVLLMTFHRG